MVILENDGTSTTSSAEQNGSSLSNEKKSVAAFGNLIFCYNSAEFFLIDFPVHFVLRSEFGCFLGGYSFLWSDAEGGKTYLIVKQDAC